MRNTMVLAAAAIMLAAFSGCTSALPLSGGCKTGCGDPDGGAPCSAAQSKTGDPHASDPGTSGQGQAGAPSDPGAAGAGRVCDHRCWLDRKCNPFAAPCRAHGIIGCKLCAAAKVAQPAAPPPAPGVVTYPYYTTRGPRDFLDRSPQPIGP